MKLALVTETFPPEVNGVAMTFGLIARELARRGHEVTVYRPRRDALPRAANGREFAEVMLPGLPVPGYPQIRLGFPAWRALRRCWEQARPDLVHVVTEGPLGASAVSTALALRLPVTSSFHTHFHEYTREYGFGLLRRPVLAWLRRVHNRTRCTFAPTDEAATELRSVGFERVALLSRGVDTWDFHPARRSPELRQRWGADADTPVVLHVGRMAPEKNYELLFRAYAAMRAANPRLKFVLAGEGPLKERLQREHPECIFAGFFTRQEIGRYYASADIYIHASRSETFGNVVTEALASGLAVAGFDYAAARQFIRHGDNGLLVPFPDPRRAPKFASAPRHEPRAARGDVAGEALVHAAVYLATDDLLRVQLRQRARDAVANQSWDAVIRKFEADLGRCAGAAAFDRWPAAVAPTA